jgi:hypothetical protein
MRIRFTRKPTREWHVWFAWRPVKLEAEWVWLERIERKVTWTYHYDMAIKDVEYRELGTTDAGEK